MSARTLREDLLEKLGGAALKKIEKSRIGIAGAGGLGSNCAAALVRAGFRKLVIADFDVIDPSNLDRQFYFADQVGMKKTEALETNLKRINPDLDLTMIDLKLSAENSKKTFHDCDAVVECLDRAEAKSMLAAALLPTLKLLVTASGLGGVGQSDEIKVRRLKPNLSVVGDLSSDIETKPALAPRVNVAAGKQADVVLEYILTGGASHV